MKSKHLKNMRIIPLLLILLSCSMAGTTTSDETADTLDTSDFTDWTEATHEKLEVSEIIENRATIFDTTEIQKIRIVIAPDNWDIMEDDLTALKKELGNSTDFSSVDNPTFVPCELFYNNIEWYYVGIRFKGNSSLFNANSNKLPFKLDFDEFEGDYPAIKNQRFYGFKQLNLKNNFNDESEMHEVVAGELFRDFGLISAHCSFYELYLNIDGSEDESGDIYYGLYTLVEEVDDTVIKTQYDDDSGNLYKPEDDGATFASGTYNEEEYGLQTDTDETYTDILELYETLNDSTRTTAETTWKTKLEAIFAVETFLKWLAVNTVMQNWDTYGEMDHNFFLYHNPDTGQFDWIPWDNNEALEDNNRCLELDEMVSVGPSWPLLNYILAIDSYETIYETYVKEFVNNHFNKTDMDPIFEGYETLIEDSVTSELSGYTFTSSKKLTTAVEELKTHTDERNSEALAYNQQQN